jgi:hypothetical protein
VPVIFDPGSRTTGQKAQTYAITGPGWTGKLPQGVKEVKSPTSVFQCVHRRLERAVYTPDGPFIPMFRLYWPKETPPSVLDGSWWPPVIWKSETLLQRIEDRIDKREACRREAEAKDLRLVELLRFVEKCVAG